MSRIGDLVRHLGGRAVFPAQFAWFLEAPWRRWVLSPQELCRRLPLSPQAIVCEIGGGGATTRARSPNTPRE